MLCVCMHVQLVHVDRDEKTFPNWSFFFRLLTFCVVSILSPFSCNVALRFVPFRFFSFSSIPFFVYVTMYAKTNDMSAK